MCDKLENYTIDISLNRVFLMDLYTSMANF